MGKLTSKDIASFLMLPHYGEACFIESVSSFEHPKENTMIFVERSTMQSWERLSAFENILVICSEEFGAGLPCANIWTDAPRLAFIRATNHFLADKVSTYHQPGIQPSASIASSAIIGKNVSIGHNCVIGEYVEIGDDTVILNNTIITGLTKIGKNCIIKSGSVIGEVGFGFVPDENSVPIHMPHFGGIMINDSVAIGANCTIERGMFENTQIDKNVKIDDFVHVGHNVVIEENVRIAAGTIICGAVRIESQCWISPGTTIRERIVIGSKAFVGLASNVVKDVPRDAVLSGNPAKPHRDTKTNRGEK